MASTAIERLGRIEPVVARDWIRRVVAECGRDEAVAILSEITGGPRPRLIDVDQNDYPQLIIACERALREPRTKPKPSDGVNTMMIRMQDRAGPFNIAVGFEGLNEDEARTLIDACIKIEQARNGTVLTPTEYGDRFSGLDLG